MVLETESVYIIPVPWCRPPFKEILQIKYLRPTLILASSYPKHVPVFRQKYWTLEILGKIRMHTISRQKYWRIFSFRISLPTGRKPVKKYEMLHLDWSKRYKFFLTKTLWSANSLALALPILFPIPLLKISYY